jgi:hypothetical protein
MHLRTPEEFHIYSKARFACSSARHRMPFFERKTKSGAQSVPLHVKYPPSSRMSSNVCVLDAGRHHYTCRPFGAMLGYNKIPASAGMTIISK